MSEQPREVDGFREQPGAKRERRRDIPHVKGPSGDHNTEPDWVGKCEVCGASPIVPATGMCGPCTFGEAETINGNW